MVKSVLDQITFIDKKLLPLFEIKSVVDYINVIYFDALKKNTNILESINKLIDEFRNIFPSKEFSLHKTNYIIKTHEQLFSLLKKCLEITSIPYEISKPNGNKYLRLISTNNLLEEYIKMNYKNTELRNSTENLLYEKDTSFIPSISNHDEISNMYNMYNMYDMIDDEILKQTNLMEKNISKFEIKSMYVDDITTKVKKEWSTTFFIDICVKPSILLNLEHYLLDSSNIKSIVIIAVSTDPSNISDMEFVKNFKCNSTIVIGGLDINPGILVNSGNNLLYDKMIIIRDLLQHHNIKLRLNTKSLTELPTSVLFCMTITYVDFYAEFNKLLANPYDGLKQHILDKNNNHNMYSTLNGMGTISFEEFTVLDDFNLLRAGKKIKPTPSEIIYDEKIMPPKIIFDGEKYILGKYIGFKNNTDITYNPLLLMKDDKYDFTTFVQKDCENNYSSFYTMYKKTYKYVLVQDIIRIADTITLLSFKIPNKIDISRLSAKIIYDKKNCKFEQLENLTLIYDDNNFIKINEINDINQLNLIGSKDGLKLILTYESDTHNNVFFSLNENVEFLTTYVYWNSEPRKEMAYNCSNFFVIEN
jgi:hypothetical protein